MYCMAYQLSKYIISDDKWICIIDTCYNPSTTVLIDWDAIYQHGLTCNPVWISNPMLSQWEMHLQIHFQSSKLAPLKFGNG